MSVGVRTPQLDMLMAIKQRRAEIERIAARHGAYNVRVFGSVARGDAAPDSDIDLLVEVGATVSPWFPAGLILELEALLGRRVEVVTSDGLHVLLKERVLEEAVPL